MAITSIFQQMWNKIDPPPEPEFSDNASSQFDYDNHATNDEVMPLFTPDQAAISDFINQEPPKRLYLLQDCLPLGKVGTIIGQGGTSKSTLALQLSIAIATGSDPCDGAWHTVTTGQVLCLMAEDDTDELHRRVNHFCKGLSNEQMALLMKNLFVKSMVAMDNLITKKQPSGEVTTGDYLERLLMTVTQFNDLKMIVIDPVSRFRGGDENTAQDATRFVEAVEQLAQITGATVLVIHHANKASTSNGASQNSARGSSAFIDGIRWAMEVRTMSEQEYKDFKINDLSRHHYMSARVVKNNYGPPQGDDIWLYRGENGLLTHVPNIDGLKGLSEARRNREIVRTIVADAHQGKYHSITSFKDSYAGKDAKFNLGKDSLGKVINQLIDAGKLSLVEATAVHKAYNLNLRDVLTATAT